MFRLTLRNLLARKVRLIMSTLAIVLGIGFLAGVMTFSSGLGSTFDGIIKGSTPDGVVRPAGTESFEQFGIGNTTVLKPSDVDALAALPEVEAANGNVDGLGLSLLDSDGKLVGGQGAPTISFNYSDTQNLLGEPSLQLVSGDWPTGTDDVVLDDGAAEKAGYEIGDQVEVITPSGDSIDTVRRTFTLVGTAEFNGGGTAGAVLVIFSTPGAQDLFLDGRDRFTSVGLTAADGVTQAELVKAADTVLPDDFEAVEGDTVAEESQAAIGEFLDVISTFLIAFAVIAILVGGFIIANTFAILVAQRVRELALLRALGASGAQIRRSVLLEAGVMALIGATGGIGVGVLLSRALASLFRSFGLDINSAALELTPGAIALGYGVALVVTLVSAYLPARKAARTAPVTAMREAGTEDGEASLRGRGWWGAYAAFLGACLAALGLLDAPGPDAAWIGAAAVVWILTAAVASPVVGRPLLLLCRSLFGSVFGAPGRLAGENTLRNSRRTGATASALMIGLALVSAVGTLAASLSATTDALIEDQFNADLVVQSVNFGSFPTGIGDEMARVDGVEVLSREQFAFTLTAGRPEAIVGITPDWVEVNQPEIVIGDPDVAGGQALVSRDAAGDFGVWEGDRLTLAFPGGKTIKVPVGAIIEPVPGPGVMVPMEALERAGIKRTDTSLNILVSPDADLQQVKDALSEVVADVPIVTVQDQEGFADSLRGQINQLLFMVYGLLALAIVIAVIGVINTLSLSVIERTREIGLLRAVGLSRSRLRRMVTLESVTISVMGAVLGMAVGLLIGVLLRQSLADDLTELALPITQLVVFLGISVFFGVVAAIIPAIRAARMKVLDAIASE